MFKSEPFIAQKDGEFCICRTFFGITQYNERSSRFDWGTKSSSVFTYHSYASADNHLKQLLKPKSKWVPAKPPITINATPV